MTKIVGILNVTPDSFSDGGAWIDPESVEERCAQLFYDGADMIDIGAESTRPGATEIRIEEEWQRLEPVLDRLRSKYRAEHFSIDTRHGEIARRAIAWWSDELMINDVTSLSDPKMVELVANHGLRVVVSHLPRAASGNISQAHKQKMANIEDVKSELSERIQELNKAGINDDKIVIDPGIGFGKSPKLNSQLVEFANETKLPVMIGYSRKRFLGERRFDPNYNMLVGRRAIMSGAAYLRVHDVKEHRDVIRKLQKVRS